MPRAVNDIPHDAPRAPGQYATSGRLTDLGRNCGEIVAGGMSGLSFDRHPTVFGNSVWSAT